MTKFKILRTFTLKISANAAKKIEIEKFMMPFFKKKNRKEKCNAKTVEICKEFVFVRHDDCCSDYDTKCGGGGGGIAGFFS